ncbi:MAG TPA: pirin family protein [Paraburkholderia sp.]
MTLETIQSSASTLRSEHPVEPFASTGMEVQSDSRRAARSIVSRTAGRPHGPVNRLFSPGDLGGLLKPFVFLDHFDISAQSTSRFPMHPHSGIATTTILLEGEVRYEDTTGASGVLSAGSVEWMNAGGGVWHDGYPEGGTRVRGYQLWTALPRELELEEPVSQYLSVDKIPQTGPVRVILGRYEGAQSPVLAPQGINYLHVRLSAGERWQYTPPAGHAVAWVSVQRGALYTGSDRIRAEVAVFNKSEDVLEFTVDEDTEFVLGSAVPHPHDLVLGYYSVHTSKEALHAGEAGIVKIGEQLRRSGQIR